MAKNSKENQIIDEFVPAEWFFLTKRPDIPPLSVWYKMKFSTRSTENKKIYGTAIPWACFWYGNNAEFYLHGKEYRLAIKRATKILYSKQKLKKYLIKLKQVCAEAKKAAMTLDSQDWQTSSNAQLLKVYKSTVDKYVLSYIYGFITWHTPVLQHDAKLIINNYRQALSKINITPEQALGILLVPDDHTLYQKKAEMLNKLAKKYQHVFHDYKSKKKLSRNYPKLYAEIINFISKYCWVGFDYTGPALDYKSTVRELLQTQDKVKFNLPTKKDIYRVCKFTNKEKHIFYALSMVAYTKDLRNVTDDYVHYCFNKFYTKAAKQNGLKKREVQFLWDEELNELLTGKRKITPKYIQKKQKICAAFSAPKSIGTKQYYIGDEARYYQKIVEKNSNRLLKMTSQNIIKGTIASTGVATGKVKIIHSVNEVGKVKKGDILVAGMTSPKYMPAIFNCSAIITDDGGLTCHAAIIARELKKPCIIGTKIATSILNDNDLIEVNSNQGIIKIIKKAKRH